MGTFFFMLCRCWLVEYVYMCVFCVIERSNGSIYAVHKKQMYAPIGIYNHFTMLHPVQNIYIGSEREIWYIKTISNENESSMIYDWIFRAHINDTHSYTYTYSTSHKIQKRIHFVAAYKFSWMTHRWAFWLSDPVDLPTQMTIQNISF